MINSTNSTHPVIEPQQSTNPAVVRPDLIGLHRFARTVRNIFFPGWQQFDNWRIKSSSSDVSWQVCCDYSRSTLTFSDLVFPDRDAFRAFLILTNAVAQMDKPDNQAIRKRLITLRDMASYIRRDRIATYIDDVISGLNNGDVSIEHGSVSWIFTTLEWVHQPESDGSNDSEQYDALFQDSLLFTELKRMLDKERDEVA